MAARGARRWKHCNLLVLPMGFLLSTQATERSIHWRQKRARWAAALCWCLSELQAFLHLPAETRSDQSVCGEHHGVSRWAAQCDHLFLRKMPLTCTALLAEIILAGTSLRCVKQAQVTKWHQTAHHGRQFLLQRPAALQGRPLLWWSHSVTVFLEWVSSPAASKQLTACEFMDAHPASGSSLWL